MNEWKSFILRKSKETAKVTIEGRQAAATQTANMKHTQMENNHAASSQGSITPWAIFQAPVLCRYKKKKQKKTKQKQKIADSPIKVENYTFLVDLSCSQD